MFGQEQQPPKIGIDEIMEKMREDKKPIIDVGQATVGSLAGGLMGTLIGALVFQKGDVDFGAILFGFFVGIFGGFFMCATASYFISRSRDSFEREVLLYIL